MSIRVTATTMGSITPGPAVLSGGYRWRGIPDWEPNHPRYRESGPAPAAGGNPRQNAAKHGERVTEFARLRAEGLSVAESARRVGVSYKTGLAYERRRRAGSREAAAS